MSSNRTFQAIRAGVMMPAALTYPGAYIDEIAGGVPTITGVATSMAAFIGRAFKGYVTMIPSP